MPNRKRSSPAPSGPLAASYKFLVTIRNPDMIGEAEAFRMARARYTSRRHGSRYYFQREGDALEFRRRFG
jgi:hypothetical protein